MSNFLVQGATAREKDAYPGDNFPGECSSQQQQMSQSQGYPPVPKDDYQPPNSKISDQPQGLHPSYGVPSQPLQKSQQREPLNGISSQGCSTLDQSHPSSNHPQHQQQLSSPQVHSSKQNPGKNNHYPPTSCNQTSHQSHPTKDHLWSNQTQKQQPQIGVPSQDHPPKDKQPCRDKKSSNQSQQQQPSTLPDTKHNVTVPSSLNEEQPVSVGSAFLTQGNHSMQQRATVLADPPLQPQQQEFPMQNYGGVDAQAKGRGDEPVIAFPDPSCLRENLNQLTMYVQSKHAQETNQLPEAVPPPKCNCCSIF